MTIFGKNSTIFSIFWPFIPKSGVFGVVFSVWVGRVGLSDLALATAGPTRRVSRFRSHYPIYAHSRPFAVKKAQFLLFFFIFLNFSGCFSPPCLRRGKFVAILAYFRRFPATGSHCCGLSLRTSDFAPMRLLAACGKTPAEGIPPSL